MLIISKVEENKTFFYAIVKNVEIDLKLRYIYLLKIREIKIYTVVFQFYYYLWNLIVILPRIF